ncbi:MAG TPA: hypothetical protein VF422_04010, partial [Dokdonella sp.]
MPADCSPIRDVLSLDGIADAARAEAIILAAACDADNGRAAQVPSRLAGLPAGDGAVGGVSPYAADRLRELQRL